MDRKEIQEILVRGFAALEIGQDEVQAMALEVRNAPTYEEAMSRFELFKKEVKRRYREKALECHPDRGGDEEAFKEFSQLLKALDALIIRAKGPRPPVRRPGARGMVWVSIVHQSPWGAYQSSGNTSTTTSATTTGNPWGS